MSQHHDNRRRAFADVVSIDAWHEPFDGEHGRADLHADIVFGTARVGGEAAAPVRFRLSVKRAEIVLVVPSSEPVSIDRGTVSRDSPDLPAQLLIPLSLPSRPRVSRAKDSSLYSGQWLGSE
jgi:hypothetical protein